MDPKLWTKLVGDGERAGTWIKLATAAVFAIWTVDALQKIPKLMLRRRIQEKCRSEKRYSVGIIGAGFGGIACARKCQDLGIPFHVYEIAEDFGGTWLFNKYPGCGCDVFSHLYSFSWAPNPDWTRRWAKRDEIFQYIQWVCRKVLNLDQHTTFLAKVKSAHFSNDKWILEVEDVRTGRITVSEHTFLMSSVGQLNLPTIPTALENTMAAFQGEAQFHTARWPQPGPDLRGKRVACIGTGASAIQICPEIAPLVKELLIFQRSPGWVLEKQDYKYWWIIKKMFRYIPFVRLIHRYYSAALADLLLWRGLIPNSAEKPSSANLTLTNFVAGEMKRRMPQDKQDLLMPKETLGCKRLLITSDWLPMFHRENVQLIRDPVTEITKRGVKAQSGKQYEDIDIIIYATGFETGSFLKDLPIKVTKSVGSTTTTIELHKDVWKTIPRAYRGVTFRDIPNFACTYAPNTNLNHSSIISIMECEVEHFGQLLEKVILGGKSRFLIKAEAFDRYNEEEQAELDRSAFNADCNSWYKRNEAGRILNNYHGSLIGFWLSTGKVKFEDYDIL